MWIERLLEQLNVLIPPLIKVYCDKNVAIAIAHNSVLHNETKHIEVEKHLIKKILIAK